MRADEGDPVAGVSSRVLNRTENIFGLTSNEQGNFAIPCSIIFRPQRRQ
jgi:hypothetical protein